MKPKPNNEISSSQALEKWNGYFWSQACNISPVNSFHDDFFSSSFLLLNFLLIQYDPTKMAIKKNKNCVQIKLNGCDTTKTDYSASLGLIKS